jgi:hypothetical protein
VVLRPITAAAFITGRHPILIRRWITQGAITAACDVATHALLVDVGEATRVSATRQTRRRSAA